MSENPNPGAEAQDEKKFLITDRTQIIRILRTVAAERASFSAVFRAGSEVLLTSVIEVDSEKGIVYLDVSVAKHHNDQLLMSKRTVFASNVDGVKTQWVSTEIKMGEHGGRPAFIVAIPDTLRHEQRRGLFRIDTPLINPVICKIPLGDGREVELPLVDICAEGIGVILPEDPPIPEIVRGAQFKNCKINLPDGAPAEVSILVRSMWHTTLKNGKTSPRAGLEFFDVRSGMQSRIQRYINFLQRNRIRSSDKPS